MTNIFPLEYGRHLLTLTIPGNLPRKSNSRILTTKGSTPRVIKSQEANNYFEVAAYYIPLDVRNSYGSLENNLGIIGNIYYRSRRSDLSIELLLDVLQEYKVVKDDRYVVEQLVRGLVDKKDPRVEFSLYEITKTHIPFNLEDFIDVGHRNY